MYVSKSNHKSCCIHTNLKSNDNIIKRWTNSHPMGTNEISRIQLFFFPVLLSDKCDNLEKKKVFEGREIILEVAFDRCVYKVRNRVWERDVRMEFCDELKRGTRVQIFIPYDKRINWRWKSSIQRMYRTMSTTYIPNSTTHLPINHTISFHPPLPSSTIVPLLIHPSLTKYIHLFSFFWEPNSENWIG